MIPLTATWGVTGASTASLLKWLCAISVSLVVGIFYKYWKNRLTVPTYGGIYSFSRALSAWRLGSKGREECLQAYTKHPIMVVPAPEAWTAMVHSKYVNEIAQAPDDVVSFLDSAAETIQMKYTFGQQVTMEHYHVQIIRNQLTRHLSALFPNVFDETQHAVAEYVGTTGKEWKTMNAFYLLQRVVSRASNRIFVGLPLCRNQAWLTLMITTAVDTMNVANFVNQFPRFLRPLAGWYASDVDRRLCDATKIVGSLVDEKLAEPEESREDDFISWLITNAPEHERNSKDIINRILITNFAAIHTTSMATVNSLYWLLARPRYFEPLYQEITEVTSRLGWSKDAIGAMPKLDSFLRECMRISPLGTQIMNRKVRKPFTFSNGFTAPPGMTISTHLYATHLDDNIYPNADVFDGFRFVQSTTAERNGGEKPEADMGVTKTMYTTSRTYLPFGHGRHACPGRFFASMEIKLILAYLIANYEMKWPDKVYDPSVPGYTEEGYRPPDLCHVHRMTPDTMAEMMIRKRGSS